jgi:hypothetical protein
VDADERVVGTAEGAAEDDGAVEDRADERTTAGQRKPQDRHRHPEQSGREHEAETRSPQRIELAIAVAHADRVAAGEHCL